LPPTDDGEAGTTIRCGRDQRETDTRGIHPM
jgi:hypothetical protein